MSDSDVVAVLDDILQEIRELRGDFRQFCGYNFELQRFNPEAFPKAPPYDLGDIKDNLDRVCDAISSLETTIDLK